LVLPIHWILIRKDTKEHFAAIVTALFFFIFYLIGMTYFWGDQFIDQLLIQLNRAVGIYSSRGVINGIDLFNASVGTYSIFIGTIVVSIGCLIYISTQVFQAIKERSLDQFRTGTSFYFSWAVAAILFFGLINLKFPQYFILTLLPVYCYVGAELIQRIRNDYPEKYSWLIGLILFLVLINFGSYSLRFVVQEDQAINDAVSYAELNIAENAIVATEEPIGVLIPQQYLRIDDWQLWIERLPPAYIITYTTQTQQLPESEQLGQLIRSSNELVRYSGFKEEIIIYEVPEAVRWKP
jgi:hypothetical protein